ncbi:MAG: succinate-semialdehyde dehydrogenase [Cytophagales bacterium CG18_big_fil_WC_8_21_14_2_50_42_9]|nr:MAG: succinate-semialdehyde dehydrogenase [Cytophagales bacterium CG18_big_fil_WC_8_21_14_2_50_42_9]
MQSINPATQEIFKIFDAHTDEALENIVAQADATFRDWHQTSFAERQNLMMKAAEILEQEVDHYAELISLEMGKPISQSLGEVKKCANVCRFYAEKAQGFLQEEMIQTQASKSFISYEPLGVILAIMPWNFPFWQVFRFAAPALMAGNTGILKHASNVPQCALAIEEVFRKAGFPVGAFTSILVGADKIEKLLQDDRIKAATLTGSEGAGSKVAEAAGREIKKVVLELGGSDAFIVLEDADIDQAVETAVNSRMINTGQSCIAAKRFMVAEPVADAFLSKMKDILESKKTGDPLEKDSDFGPLARRDLATELQKQVIESVGKGALVYLAGGQEDPDSAYFKPMILTDVAPGMPAYDDELFGPVATVFRVKDEQEAIRIANDHRYGLAATIFTQDTAKAEKLAHQIESGNVFINAMVQSSPEMPFGGVKKSGFGRELSYIGIREFVNLKSIWIG